MTFIAKTKTALKKVYTDNVKFKTPVNDVISGSTVDTIADTHADSQFEQQVEIKNILDLDNLDNKFGDELDTEGLAYSILRKQAAKATSNVEVIDSAISKVSSSVATGGASIGDGVLNVTGIVGTYPATGFILIGERTEPEFEQLAYTELVAGVFTLSSTVTKDHGAGEPVVLKTVGDRNFSLGQTVFAISDDGVNVNFSISDNYIIYDGEEKAINVPVIADEVGVASNVPANSITNFEGTAPFEGALVTNPTVVDNGIEKESDPSYRDVLKNAPFILSRGVRKAVVDEVRKAEINGQRVQFVQPFESVDQTQPSLMYIDDGSGFVPTEEIVLEEVLLEAAIGGENLFFLSGQPRLKKNGLGSTTIALYKNATNLLVEGTHFKMNFHDGTIELQPTYEMQAGESLQAGKAGQNGYVKYTGLLQEAQWRIDGRKSDPTNYVGAKAFGPQITATVPITQDVSIELTIFTSSGTAKSFVRPEIIQNLLEYIASITIGGIILLDQLRLAVLRVTGVIKVDFAEPLDDVELPVGIKARVVAANITIT